MTDLSNAATALENLILQEQLSNARTVWGVDTGIADHMAVNPLADISAYDPGLILICDVAVPNQTTTPKLSLGSLGEILITASSGNSVPVGVMSGKCVFGFSSVSNGFVARLLFSPITVTSSDSGGSGGSGGVNSPPAGASQNNSFTSVTNVNTSISSQGVAYNVPFPGTPPFASTDGTNFTISAGNSGLYAIGYYVNTQLHGSGSVHAISDFWILLNGTDTPCSSQQWCFSDGYGNVGPAHQSTAVLWLSAGDVLTPQAQVGMGGFSSGYVVSGSKLRISKLF